MAWLASTGPLPLVCGTQDQVYPSRPVPQHIGLFRASINHRMLSAECTRMACPEMGCDPLAATHATGRLDAQSRRAIHVRIPPSES